jgi:hypothetical protein
MQLSLKATPMHRIILVLAFLSACSPMVWGQILHGHVRDAANSEPVPQAVVRIKGRIEGAQTDSLGQFTLHLDQNAKHLEITRLGYQNATVAIPTQLDIPFDIRLHAKADLPDVLITAGASRVLEDPRLHMYDYDFLDGGIIMILYDRQRKHSELAWVDANDKVVSRADSPEPPGKLVRDCMGNVHAMTKHFVCQLFTSQDHEISMYVDSLELYERFVAPCLQSIAPYYYYRHDRANGQVVDYYHINALTQKASGFLHLIDREKIHQMLDPMGPYVQFASSQEGFMSLHPEMWEKINRMDHEMQFNRLAFFGPIHAPLRVVDNEILVFDHTNLLLRKYSPEGNPLDSVAISYPKESHWDMQILIDEVRGEAYTTFAQHGYISLREIDLKSGELRGGKELPKQFPMKIQVRDGVAYFMYREQEHEDTNRLWRMKLKD